MVVSKGLKLDWGPLWRALYKHRREKIPVKGLIAALYSWTSPSMKILWRDTLSSFKTPRLYSHTLKSESGEEEHKVQWLKAGFRSSVVPSWELTPRPKTLFSHFHTLLTQLISVELLLIYISIWEVSSTCALATWPFLLAVSVQG